MTLYCGIDLHSNISVVAVLDEQDGAVYEKRLPNDIEAITEALCIYQSELAACVVESTYNWYWLVNGLMEAGFPVYLAHTSALPEYSGLKYSNDYSDARHGGQRLNTLQIKQLTKGNLADYLQGYAFMGGEVTHQARCCLENAVQRTERELQRHIKPREDYQLLQSIPGVGSVLSTTITLGPWIQESKDIINARKPRHISWWPTSWPVRVITCLNVVRSSM